MDVGSSFLPGEITAAFLSAQMDAAEDITARRLAIWDRYHAWAEKHERDGKLQRPTVPAHCTHNAHMYYVLLPSLEVRSRFIAEMKQRGVQTVFHYIPLHSSPAGLERGRTGSDMTVTDDISVRLVRLPLWVGVEGEMDTLLQHADAALDVALG
ncbi:TPA: DegT/DnrJ/EryC1/StrS family aminotransferase [Stenotrophomonas maltophilia]